jgi:hypothetical protein
MTQFTRKSVRAGSAMQIAGIDRDKFNAYVADGYFNCAPPARNRASRVFEYGDLIALCVFADLLAFGFKPREAGRFACIIRQRDLYTKERIVIVRGHRISEVFLPEEFDTNTTHIPALGDILSYTVLRLDTVSRRVLNAIREIEETAIIGDDDDAPSAGGGL